MAVWEVLVLGVAGVVVGVVVVVVVVEAVADRVVGMCATVGEARNNVQIVYRSPTDHRPIIDSHFII